MRSQESLAGAEGFAAESGLGCDVVGGAEVGVGLVSRAQRTASSRPEFERSYLKSLLGIGL
jgi:hypothetical protein